MTTQISGDTGVSQCQPGSVSQDDLAANVTSNGAAFRVRADANQSLSGATKILFPAVNYDKTSNVASSRFTAPVDGIYSFSATIRLTATSWANCFSFLYKNGAQYSPGAALRQATAVSNAPVLVLHDQLTLLAGDYIEVFASIDGTSQTAAFNDVATCSSFCGCLVRAA